MFRTNGRSEQWLLSIYEENAAPDAAEGESLSIALALRDNSSYGDSVVRSGSGEDEGGRLAESGGQEVDAVRVGVVAVDVRTGKLVHDAFAEGSGQRRELDTRLRHLRYI